MPRYTLTLILINAMKTTSNNLDNLLKLGAICTAVFSSERVETDNRIRTTARVETAEDA